MSKNRDSSRPEPPRGRSQPTSPAAKERLASALRENLQRRKAQARGQDEQQHKTESEDEPG